MALVMEDKLMNIHFQPITQEQAEQIAYHWHYEGIYAFYNMEADEEDLVEFLNPEIQKDSILAAVTPNNELIGFLSIHKPVHDIAEIGLGLRPDLTGRGMGLVFLLKGIEFVKERYSPLSITLAVATFNKRAITVYKRSGFVEEETFIQTTNGSKYEFVKMKLNCV